MAGNATTDTDMGGLITQYYDKMLLERLTPELRYDQFGEAKVIPRNEGKTVVWTRLDNWAQGYALTELTVPGLSAYSASKVSATLVQYGSLIGISDLFDMTSLSQPVKDAVALLADSAVLTVDSYIKEEIGFGSAASTGVTGHASVTYLSCRTQGFPLQLNSIIHWTAAPLANDMLSTGMCVDRVRGAVTQLRTMNAKPFADGYYAGIIHPFVADRLMNDTATGGWIDWNKYTSPDAMYKGEIGRIQGVRFVSSTNAMTSTVLASAWAAGGSQYSAGGTLYGTLIVGKGAYGVTKMYAGNGVQTSVVDFKADKADPLGQYGTAGYKITLAAKILNPSAGIIMVDGVRTA